MKNRFDSGSKNTSIGRIIRKNSVEIEILKPSCLCTARPIDVWHYDHSLYTRCIIILSRSLCDCASTVRGCKSMIRPNRPVADPATRTCEFSIAARKSAVKHKRNAEWRIILGNNGEIRHKVRTSPSVLDLVQFSTRCLSQNTSDLTTNIAPTFTSSISNTLCMTLLVVFHVLRWASSTTHKPDCLVSGL